MTPYIYMYLARLCIGFFEKLLATLVAIKSPFIESGATSIVLPEPPFKLIVN
jgi:hypothetical protein